MCTTATLSQREALFTLIYGLLYYIFRILPGLTSMVRAIQHDPELYPEPHIFNPDRWLSPKYPTTYREPLTQYPNMNNYSVFGFGRRLCPGAHIAERSVNIIAARIAWACNLRKSIDPLTGEEITPPEYDCKCRPVNSFSSDSLWKVVRLISFARFADKKGTNTEPRPFPFDLTIRSPERLAVLESTAQEAREDLRRSTFGS